MYKNQQTLDPMRQQCAALKERVDRWTGHSRTVVKPRNRAILVLIEEGDIERLKGRIPDAMGIFPVDIELKRTGRPNPKKEGSQAPLRIQ